MDASPRVLRLRSCEPPYESLLHAASRSARAGVAVGVCRFAADASLGCGAGRELECGLGVSDRTDRFEDTDSRVNIVVGVGSFTEVTMPTEAQLLDAKLQEHIAQRISEGRLPVTLPEQSEVAAHGSGSKCDACDQPITSHQVEYDVEDLEHGTRLMLHFGCHLLWQIECVKRVQLAP